MLLDVTMQALFGNLSLSNPFSADVTAFLTKYCSGKRECHIPNIEAFFEAYHTCPDDLKSYILASYECVKGR